MSWLCTTRRRSCRAPPPPCLLWLAVPVPPCFASLSVAKFCLWLCPIRVGTFRRILSRWLWSPLAASRVACGRRSWVKVTYEFVKLEATEPAAEGDQARPAPSPLKQHNHRLPALAKISERRKCCAQEPEPEPEEAAGPVATDEASLLAALMWGEPVTLARGTVIRLTRTLLICSKEPKWSAWNGNVKFTQKEDYHCECRRLRPRRERQSAGGACAPGGRREG